MRVAFIDEVKQNPYLLVIYVTQPGDLPKMRKGLRAMVLRGQRSIHFTKESPSRRRKIISWLKEQDIAVYVIRCRSKKGNAARSTTLRTLFAKSIEWELVSMFLELDRSTIELDRHTFRAESRMTPNLPWPYWDHVERNQEPLLWFADAVAWCVNRGGEWERMVRPMIVETIEF